MRRLLLLGLLAAFLVPAAPASAHTCADYSNQAAAQRAKDTRDADGDGIYCESLPCPCLKPGSSGSSRRTSPAPSSRRRYAARPRTGHTVLFGPRRRTRGCDVHGGLPDAACTPGAYYGGVTRAMVCTPGYSSSVRAVGEFVKDAVFAEYSVQDPDARTYEVDHLVPLELGGSNVIANLFAQPATPRPGFHEKDRLENALHARVCAGEMALRTAQRLIAGNWVAAYRRYG